MSGRDPERARRAAEELTDAAAESYKIAVERAFTARESSVRMTRDFFEEGMGLMEEGVELNLRTTRRLAEIARQQRETFRQLSEGSNEAYTGFLDSLYVYGEGELEDKSRRDSATGGEPGER